MSNIYFYMGGYAPHTPATLWVRPKPRLLTAPKSYFNPLLHFVKPEVHLISSENRGVPLMPKTEGFRS